MRSRKSVKAAASPDDANGLQRTDRLDGAISLQASNTKPEVSSDWRKVLPVHPAAGLFPLMSEPELRELGEDIRANKLQFPIATWFDPEGKELLIDGRNRLDAMELVGLSTAEAISWRSKLTCIDPWDFVVSANIKRRHLTPEQKRELIAKVIEANPNKSDRQIAEIVKRDHKAVGRVRANMEDVGRVPHVKYRTDSIGREQPTKKPKKARRTKAAIAFARFDKTVRHVAIVLEHLEDESIPPLDTEHRDAALSRLNEPKLSLDSFIRRIKNAPQVVASSRAEREREL
jgi:hypothetical protein